MRQFTPPSHKMPSAMMAITMKVPMSGCFISKMPSRPTMPTSGNTVRTKPSPLSMRRTM